jgi:site-specific DNA-cytosine methylase
MSPPCQPYTRTGVQLADKDPRAKSFLNFLKLLPELKSLNYFLIENVQGFENSPTHTLLIKACKENGFKYQQFLLNPLHLGIPNSRLRFYFLAKRDDLPDFEFQELNDIIFHSDKESNDLSKLNSDSFDRVIEWFKLTKDFNSTLNDYLGESLSKVELLDLRSIPEKVSKNYFQNIALK